MSVRRCAGPWVSGGSKEEVKRRAGRRDALPGRKDIVVWKRTKETEGNAAKGWG